MELREYWHIFARRWWLAFLPAVVVALYTGLTYDTPATLYQAHMNFVTGQPAEQKPQDFTYDGYYAWLTSEYIANGLADIARRERFAAAVSARLAQEELLIPPGAVQGSIASDNAQSLFVIYLTWGDPETLLSIADAVTAELTENAAAYFPQFTELEGDGGGAPVIPPARRVDNPVPVAVPPSLRSQLTGPAIRIALGLVVGLATVFLLHYLDPTVREPEELEAMGYTVLGRIPRRSRWPFGF